MSTDPTLSAMYQDALLAHYRAPHNRRVLTDATGTGTRRNPLCGDAIEVQVRVEHGRIADVAFTGRGCSIATASGSMLTDIVRGLSPHDAARVADAVEAMLRGDDPSRAESRAASLPASLEALRGVAPFPARHGCATMPWFALRDALAGSSDPER